MKNNTKPTLLKLSAAIFATVLLAPGLKAADITGSIGFGSLGASITGGTFATATSFTLTSPFITTETGTYSGVPLATAITYGGFQFNPAVPSVTPLWSFDVGAIGYSFDATSMMSTYDPTRNEWDIGGNGTANVTGFTSTPGTWNVNLSQSGASIVFDSSAAVNTMPEPSALALMGGGLVGLAAFGRKLKD